MLEKLRDNAARTEESISLLVDSEADTDSCDRLFDRSIASNVKRVLRKLVIRVLSQELQLSRTTQV